MKLNLLLVPFKICVS